MDNFDYTFVEKSRALTIQKKHPLRTTERVVTKSLAPYNQKGCIYDD